jgi:hypothetical protein
MEYGESTSKLVERARNLLASSGLAGWELVSSSPESSAFGNSEAVFRLGPVQLRFTRDRGQEFLDCGSTLAPTVFHQFDDVDIAMGWRSVDEVLAKREPEDLGAVLARVRTHLVALEEALSGERERLTRARLERAARERGEAFTARLRGG